MVNRACVFRKFIVFFLLTLTVQYIHIFAGMPGYDLSYLLIIAGLLTLGDFLSSCRLICFFLSLFMVDFSPGFILLPGMVFLLAKRNITPNSLDFFHYKIKKDTAF